MSVLRKFGAELTAGWRLALEYRIAALIWTMSMVLPIVMMSAWISIAQAGAIGRFGPSDFVAYYLATLLIRNITGVWIIWEMDSDIRGGQLSFKLLKPVNPIYHYAASSLVYKPIRVAIALATLIGGTLLVPGVHFTSDPTALALLLVTLAATWGLLFFMQYSMGLLAFWITQATSLHDVWYIVFSLFSGYLVPLDLFPPGLRDVLHVLPFRYMMSFPVEVLTGRLGPGEILQGLALECMWLAVFFGIYRFVWARGLKRFSAVGA